MRWLYRALDFRLFNGPDNGGGGGGTTNTGLTRGEGGGGPFIWPPPRPATPEPEAPAPPPPPGPGDPGFVRQARNVQRANIDRTSYYDPAAETLAMGQEYLTSRSASNPRPPGDTGVGAVGYDLPDGNFPERIY